MGRPKKQKPELPKLLDCPFCGGHAEMIMPTIMGEKCRSVMCRKCKAKVTNFAEEKEEKGIKKAAAAWNRRAPAEAVDG